MYSPYTRRDLNVFVLWMMMIVADGKGGGIVVNTTDLCTLNLIATLAHNGEQVCRHKVNNRAEMCTEKYDFHTAG